MGVLASGCHVVLFCVQKTLEQAWEIIRGKRDNRLFDNACRRCGRAVASRGPMGQIPNRLPTACGLALERGASPSGLARGVAQKRRERPSP